MLKSLERAETKPLKSLLKENVALVIFKTNCSSCRAQIKDLDCLVGKYKVNLIGAYDSEQQLRKDYIKYYKKYDSYYGDPLALVALRINDRATPQTLLIKDGKITKVMGQKSCKKLLEV